MAERAGYGLTRGVIANIESGRKADITVDQLLALSYVLGVPPAVLALPVDQPHRYVRMAEGLDAHAYLRAFMALHWFRGDVGPRWDRFLSFREETSRDAQTIANEIMRVVGELTDLEWLNSQTDDTSLQDRIDRLTERLVELGVDVATYKIDE